MIRFVAVFFVVAVFANAGEPTVGLTPGDFSAPLTAYEIKSFPTRPAEGVPLPDGLRHWEGPLLKMESYGCYVSFLERNTPGGLLMEKWENEWGADAARRGLVREQGPTLATLGAVEVAAPGTLVDDVFTPAAPGKLDLAEPKTLSPLRGMTRSHVIRDPEYGYVALVSVCSDYLPGRVFLMPALLTSPDGQPGTWTYRGLLKGEPQEELAQRGRPVWSDAGTIHRMPDGSWRVYVDLFAGHPLEMLTAPHLDGPWRFHRAADGAIANLLDGLPRPKGSCFPHVLKVSDTEWHAWISDQWPVQAIWHYTSPDGVAWKPYGQQPEINRALVNGHGIKCLRTYRPPGERTVYGFLSVWGDGQDHGRKGWRLHVLRLSLEGKGQ